MEANKATMQYLTDLKRTGKAKTEALKAQAKVASRKAVMVLAVVGAVSTGTLYGISRVADFFDENALIVKLPVEVAVKTNRVVEIQPRVKTLVVSERTEKVAEIVAGEDDKDLATYICEKWGVVECKTALAVAKAESGMRCDAYNANTNGSVDLSVFQLNTIHLAKGGEWTLANMANCRKNVDLAYEVWQAQGWSPWVAYRNGSWLAKL